MIITNEIKTILINPEGLTSIDLLNIKNHIDSIQGFAELEKELALIEYKNNEVINKLIDALCEKIEECSKKGNFDILVDMFCNINNSKNTRFLEFYVYVLIMAFHKTNLKSNKYNLKERAKSRGKLK